MNHEHRAVNRRHLLQGILSAIAVTRLPAAKASALCLADDLHDLIYELASDGSLVRLGNRYLDVQRDTQDRARLQVELSDEVAASLRSVPGDVDLLQRAERAIRLDFDRDRVCVLDGWWLSQTEVNLCALAALHA